MSKTEGKGNTRTVRHRQSAVDESLGDACIGRGAQSAFNGNQLSLSSQWEEQYFIVGYREGNTAKRVDAARGKRREKAGMPRRAISSFQRGR